VSVESVEAPMPEGEAEFGAQVPLERPYPGLRAFELEDAPLFFGRDAHVDQCVARLQQSRFLAVVGSSGAGKSSLVRAGLLPALSLGLLRGADEQWEFLLFRPGADPIGALVSKLETLGRAPGKGSELSVESRLRARSSGLIDVVAKSALGRKNLLIVVDQFEELFRLGREQQSPDRWDAERALFVRLILEPRLQSSVPIFVAITMRTDFLEDCTRFLDLPEALNASQFLVPRLTREQLEQAIVEPVQGRISWTLVRQVLSDAIGVTDDPEKTLPNEEQRRQRAVELPVVQHALMRTWQRWLAKLKAGQKSRESELGTDDYEDAGTVDSALDQHADEVFLALDAEGREAAEVIFRRLTLVGSDGRATRSPATFENLERVAAAAKIAEPAETVTRVIDAYRQREVAFLMPPQGEALGPSTEIDISHEALLRTWQRLKTWARLEHEAAATYTDLVAFARLDESGQGQLLSGRRLIASEEWWREVFRPNVAWARRYHTLDAAVQEIQDRDRSDSARPETTREREQREAATRARIDAWHQQQFEQVERYLQKSLAAREAAEAAERSAAHAQERVQRFRRLSVILGLGLLTAGTALAVIVSQRQTITVQDQTILQKVRDLEAALKREAEQRQLAVAKQAEAELAKAFVLEQIQEVQLARLKAEQATKQESEQRLVAEKALVNEAAARAALANERDDLRKTRDQLTDKKKQLEATIATLSEQNDRLAQRVAASALSDQERVRLQGVLADLRRRYPGMVPDSGTR
jgi:hypothetical protein